MRWYEYLGGRKAYQALVAAGLIFGAFVMLVDKASHFWELILGILAAFGIFTYGNVQEHKNGGAK